MEDLFLEYIDDTIEYPEFWTRQAFDTSMFHVRENNVEYIQNLIDDHFDLEEWSYGVNEDAFYQLFRQAVILDKPEIAEIILSLHQVDTGDEEFLTYTAFQVVNEHCVLSLAFHYSPTFYEYLTKKYPKETIKNYIETFFT